MSYLRSSFDTLSSTLGALYHTFLDALFPVSRAEIEVFSYTPQSALENLPLAPRFRSRRGNGNHDNAQSINQENDGQKNTTNASNLRLQR
jgi:hypothetical protein